jgi:hypothetical protein
MEIIEINNKSLIVKARYRCDDVSDDLFQTLKKKHRTDIVLRDNNNGIFAFCDEIIEAKVIEYSENEKPIIEELDTETNKEIKTEN